MESVISLFFCLGPRGDAILFRDYRGDGRCEIKAAVADFYSVVTGVGRAAHGGGKSDPVLCGALGVHYVYIKRAGMYFVVATRHNASPSFLLEFLVRLLMVFKDFCGVLSEEACRVNFVLLYEVLDEAIDAGYIQTTDVSQLKLTISSEPIPVADLTRRAPGRKTLAPSAANRPVTLTQPARGGIATKRGGEIFVDVLERLSAVLTMPAGEGRQAALATCSVEGTVLCKSYLTGSPWLRMALAQDLVIGGRGGVGPGTLVLDDCNFHACVQTEELGTSRTLTLVPPEGEFALLNYRLSSNDLAMPLRVMTVVEEPSACRVELHVKLTCDVAARLAAHNVVLRFPVPATTTTVWPQVQKEEAASAGPGPGGRAASAASAASSAALEHDVEYSAKDKLVRWSIKKLSGGASATLRTRISLSQPSEANIRRALGPITLEFEVPDYNLSKFRVRGRLSGDDALQPPPPPPPHTRTLGAHHFASFAETQSTQIIDVKHQYDAASWCRYVLSSTSYTVRL